MSFNIEFQRLIQEIKTLGQESKPRDLRVKEYHLGILELYPTDVFADFESRKFNFKYFAGELAWYMSQDRDINYINQFSGFWKNITNPGTNEINSNYGNLLFLWDVLLGTARFSRRYPPAFGLMDDRRHGPESWVPQMIYPLKKSQRSETVMGSGAHQPPR